MDLRPPLASDEQASDPLLEKLADYQARLVSRAELVTAEGTVYEPLPVALQDLPATIVNDITVDTVHLITYFALGDPSAPQLRWELVSGDGEATPPWLTSPVGEVIEKYREQASHVLTLLAGVDLDQPPGRPMPGRRATIRSLVLEVLASTAAAYGQMDLLFHLAQGGYTVIEQPSLH